jgi:hypothetical protein
MNSSNRPSNPEAELWAAIESVARKVRDDAACTTSARAWMRLHPRTAIGIGLVSGFVMGETVKHEIEPLRGVSPPSAGERRELVAGNRWSEWFSRLMHAILALFGLGLRTAARGLLGNLTSSVMRLENWLPPK